MIRETIKNIQNPAIGAYLIWKTALGYCSKQHPFVSMHLLFLVIPMLLNQKIYQKVKATKATSTLYNLISKLTPNEFIQINEGVSLYKELTFESLGLAARTGLIKYDGKDRIVPLKINITPQEVVRDMGTQGIKLGKWFEKLSLSQIIRITMVK